MRTQDLFNSEIMDEAERLNWLRLIRTDNIGPITFYQLIENFGSAGEALKALPELSRRGGRKKPLSPPSDRKIMTEYKALTKRGGTLLTVRDAAYPLALTSIYDAPPVLSVLGDPAIFNNSCVAIVGARNASINGRKFASKLAYDLSKHDQVIVSGMARGVDTAAHKGAIAGDGSTIAVLAGGVDNVYPEENQALYEQIIEKGAVVSENAWSAKPYAAAFPKRNRIVSGLSKAVIVGEANLRSGTLITARMAGEQGRDIMAIPGSPADPRSTGPNHLIREGATLVRNAEDILEILMDFSGNTLREPVTPFPLFSTPFEDPAEPIESQAYCNSNIRDISPETIFSNLSFTPISVDELARACHVTISELHFILMELELAGRINRLPGNEVSLQKQ